MAIKIKQRQLKAWLETAVNEDRYLPEWEGFWRELSQNTEVWRQSEQEPLKITTPWGVSTWFYKDTRFDVRNSSGLSDEEIKLLIRDALDRERKKLERLQSLYASGDSGQHRRVVIPNDVRMFVWKRDGGVCVKCGSNRNLEYDHIIPVSKGGSSTARNLQLLCEDCNRDKSNHI
jgi:hypothetical protein